MNTFRSLHFRPGFAILAALALAGCTTYPLMPVPVLYTGEHARPLFTDVPASQRTTPLDLLYVTDRAAAASEDVGAYTAGRSRNLAFGSTTVEFGDAINWDTLAAQSTTADRRVSLNLRLGPTTELGRFPPIPYEVERIDGGISRAQAVIAAHQAAKSKLQAEVARRLAAAPRKEVVLFVHGYAYTFEEAALTMGDLCHFLGREFVCAIFTWPAGGGGDVFFGYDVDRESGEFATEDLKKTIRMIAETPGLQKIHLLAHSRGTDLIATAVSDLSVEAYITRTTLAKQFKVGNIVLIAPDLDVDVAPVKIWKMVSDPDLPYGSAPDPTVILPLPELHITVYVSPNDKALALSGWRFGSLARLGRVEAGFVTAEDSALPRVLGSFDVVLVDATSCFICHDYFISDPRVSSDLIALLRYGSKPNEPGRPLIEGERPIWRIPTTE